MKKNRGSDTSWENILHENQNTRQSTSKLPPELKLFYFANRGDKPSIRTCVRGSLKVSRHGAIDDCCLEAFYGQRLPFLIVNKKQMKSSLSKKEVPIISV